MKYFNTFDAIRFFAFFTVFLQHLPRYQSEILDFFMRSGAIGVQIFFILSGFLISYILIIEKEEKHKINLKNFFFRRILRIWPLYYLMILFAFLTPYILNFLSLDSSNDGYEPNWFYPLLFLENYQMMINNSFANVSPLRVMWSLCIEEHFYIVWGVVFYFLSSKRIPLFFLLSIIISLIFRFIYKNYMINDIDLNTNILYFSFGGILSYILVYKENVINELGKIPRYIKNIIALFCILLYFLIPSLKIDSVIFEPLLVGSITSLLISLTLCKKHPLLINKNNIFSRLGKYTYAMYLFHTILINLIVKFSSNFSLIFLLSLITTIISSILSYYLFENQFLKLKKFFY
ncbi:acyltransferase [Chishuiella sp.]|uniref:acyltransferase family protein n=1 Tax=Chishuiella sp. TaxID=1969467 RepID=UPI0028A68907|nr:acyltransferase [Chishuiella sp.]